MGGSWTAEARSGKPQSGEREVALRTPSSKDHEESYSSYPSNTIITSKYTVFNFVPKNIFEQLHKAANSYFLIISVIMFIGNYTDLFHGFIKFYSTFAALVVMMTASAVIAALDDKRRHEADTKTNSQIAIRVCTDGSGSVSCEEIRWADIAVGDYLIVKGEQEFPADLVPLASSGDEGGCYVSTANLDGETNLKLKQSASCTQKALCDRADSANPLLDQAVDRLSRLSGRVVAEAPQKSIHTFKGRVQLEGSADEALGAKQLLLRGTILRNTAWVVGVVAYTGPETRMVMNSRKAKAKYANLEMVINNSMLVVVGAQCLMALISCVLYLATKEKYLSYWYLYPSGETTHIILPEPIGYWLTFFVLYSNLMPISLYFTMEVCNAAQAYFIKSDLQMYDEEIDCPANARSTNLGHELGQVSYVFSDKTGTLTQNVMELKRVSIAGQVYGEVGEEYGFQGGSELAAARRQDARHARAIDAFLEVLAVSHTVVSNIDQSGNLKYEAESPDEGALVEGVRHLGWAFTGRTSQGLSVEVGLPGQAQSVTYTILALNAFTSARKRQSVVVRRPSGEVVLLVKGADDIMQKLAADPGDFPDEHLQLFAKQGLRTLVLGRRSLAEPELTAWQAEYARAQTSMEDREGALAKVAEKIERSLEIVGVTAIEDKLQVGVQSTIVKVRQAGIKLWVLTGDKLETARNIGFSTRVLSPEMQIFVLDVGSGPLEEQVRKMEVESHKADSAGQVVALLVTGQALEEITRLPVDALSPSKTGRFHRTKGVLEEQFLKLAMVCSVVIACRVSPLQKSEVVRIVRKGVTPTPVTLAIGDGANDVPMIQEAQVGVGISGKEGRQAVNSADFAISQFRYLERLLLVHGRWNYRRTCKFVIYSFWKNAVLVLLMFYYTFVSGYAGMSLFEDMVRASYNFVLAVPIIATGVFEQDVSETEALLNPQLYECGREGLDLNATKLVEMLMSALVHSFVIGAVMLLAFHNLNILGIGDYYSFGTIVFTVLVIAMNYRAAFVTRTWNRLTLAAQAFSFGLYGFFLLVYCFIKPVTEVFQPWMYLVPIRMFSSPLFWICAITVPALAIVIDVFKYYVLYEFYPDRSEVLIEQWKLAQEKRNRPAEDAASSGAHEAAPLQGAQVHSSGRRLTAMDRVSSSYDFSHPSTEPRHHNHFTASHPAAGDTSLVDAAVPSASLLSARHRGGSHSRMPAMGAMPAHEELGSSEESGSEMSVTTSEKAKGADLTTQPNYPDDSGFAQQRLQHVQIIWTWQKVTAAAVAVGFLLLSLGLVVLALGQNASEVRVQYTGDEGASTIAFDWEGTRSALVYSPCVEKLGSEVTCQVELVIPKDMHPPILMLSHMDPFYQNFPSYIASGGTGGAWSQMTGKLLPHGKFPKNCDLAVTRRNATGQLIFPCGLQATSVFNDTFSLRRAGAQKDLPISEEHIAFASDVARMVNPPSYPDDPSVDWLYQRYPDVIPLSEGVKNQRFVDWMRPAALPSMMKDLGRIDAPLLKGDKMTLTINSRFPVSSLGVKKELVIMSLSPLGGSSVALGHFLLYAGAVCWVLALTVLAIRNCCKRRRGDGRFRAGVRNVMCEEGRRDSDDSCEDSDSSESA